MKAYKFLQPGAVAPFSGYAWQPAEWLDAGGADPCRVGIHACRVRDLPYWLAAELWEIELDGAVVEQERKLVAPRGRLVRRIDRWNEKTAAAFRAWCVTRAQKFAPAYAGDVRRIADSGRTPLTAFATARGAEMNGGADAYLREREAQADWLASRLGFSGWRRALARPRP
jgi:hypothetical protein